MSETETAMTELMADKPKGPSREQTTKMLLDKYPGHISWASDRANFSGCRVVTFYAANAEGLEESDAALFAEQWSAKYGDPDDAEDASTSSPEDAMNLYFSTRANLLVVNMVVNTYGITCLITTQLDDEDLEELQESQQFLEVHMRKWREDRAKRREAEATSVAEIRRLAAIGKKVEEHNLLNKLRELEEKLAAKGD